jgi:hypothetical protein
MSSTAWGMSSPIALPHCTWLALWHHPVRSPCTVAVSCEWSARPERHCSRLSARLVAINRVTYPNVLHAMMAQVSGVSETCGRALETCEPSHMGRSAKPFFILKAHGPLRGARHVTAPELS